MDVTTAHATKKKVWWSKVVMSARRMRQVIMANARVRVVAGSGHFVGLAGFETASGWI